jgi:hypothetical protein
MCDPLLVAPASASAAVARRLEDGAERGHRLAPGGAA